MHKHEPFEIKPTAFFSLFAIPTLVTILSTYLSPNRHLEIVPQLEINQKAFVVIFGRQIFPQIIRIYHRPALFIC